MLSKATAESPVPPDLSEVTRRLRAAYWPTLPALRPEVEPLDAVVRLILGQQNTSQVARRQFEALRLTYPRWEAALLDGPEGLEDTLRAAGGLSRVKASHLHALLSVLEGRGGFSLRFLHDLDDDQVRGELEALPGVGQKTASLTMLFHLRRPAMPVDSHIERLLKRLEWVAGRWNANRVERWLDQVMPRDWETRYAFHLSGVRHGQRTCLPRRPLCQECVLSDLCPSAALFMEPEPQ